MILFLLVLLSYRFSCFYVALLFNSFSQEEIGEICGASYVIPFIPFNFCIFIFRRHSPSDSFLKLKYDIIKNITQVEIYKCYISAVTFYHVSPTKSRQAKNLCVMW